MSLSATNALTSEQLQRMERNKQKAQERLLAKRKRPPENRESSCLKNPRYQTSSPVEVNPQLNNMSSATITSYYTSSVACPTTLPSSLLSSQHQPPSHAQQVKQAPPSQPIRAPREIIRTPLVSSPQIDTPHSALPLQNSVLKPRPSLNRNFFHQSIKTSSRSTEANYNIVTTTASSAYQKGDNFSKRNQPPASKNTLSLPQGQSKLSSQTSSERHGQCISLQKKIKANFVMISRRDFKVMLPFDAQVIEIFKKIKTRSYGKVIHIATTLLLARAVYRNFAKGGAGGEFGV